MSAKGKKALDSDDDDDDDDDDEGVSREYFRQRRYVYYIWNIDFQMDFGGEDDDDDDDDDDDSDDDDDDDDDETPTKLPVKSQLSGKQQVDTKGKIGDCHNYFNI